MQRNDGVLLARPGNSRPWSSWNLPAYNPARYGAAINPGTRGVFSSCCCLTPGRRKSWRETNVCILKTTRFCWKLHVSAGARTSGNGGLVNSTVATATPIFRLWTLLCAFLLSSKPTMDFFPLPNVPEGCGKLALNQPGKGRRNCDGVRLVFWPQGAVFSGLSSIINQLS